ncbi:general substrate transporter [Trichoderma austrokoningii]
MFGSRSISIKGATCGYDALLLAVITSIAGFLFGYDIGQISGILLFDDFHNRFLQDGPAATVSLIVSFMSIGCLVGSLLGAYSADWLGRRKSIALGVLFFLAGDIVQITAGYSWFRVTLGRFVAGLGIGNLSVGVPMFQSECVPREIRGAVVTSYQLLITIGILIGNLVCFLMSRHEGDGYAWRLVIGIGAIFSLTLGLGILIVPESPRWLAGRDDWEIARRSLSQLRGKAHDPGDVIVENDMHEMREILALERQSGTGTWLECFSAASKVPKTRYRTLLGMGIHFLQQWTGINYFFYYGTSIFASTEINDPLMIQLVLGAVNVFTTLLAAAWLVVFATLGTVDAFAYSTVMIIASCMFIASFAATWGPTAWVVMGETFTLRTRAKQAALATASNWFGNFLIGLLTPYAANCLDYKFGFILAGANILAAVLVYFFLYESTLLTLESVDIMYSINDLAPWDSHFWVPPGYVTRRKRDDEHFRKMSISATADISSLTQEMVDMVNNDVVTKPKVAAV